MLFLFSILCVPQDKRLSGGYENVPTDDIHMNQVSCTLKNQILASCQSRQTRTSQRTNHNSKLTRTAGRYEARENARKEGYDSFYLCSCLVVKIATFLWSVENWSCKEFVYFLTLLYLHLNTSIIFADRLWETLASLSQRVYCTCQRQVVPWLQLWGKTKPDSSSLSIFFKI